MLYESNREDRYNDYVAVVQRTMLDLEAARYGADITLPRYTEYMYPETIKHESAKEIKAQILEKLQQ